MKKSILALLFIVLSPVVVHADDPVNTMHAIIESDMIADGYFARTESITLVVGKSLKGSGYFEAPQISITVENFEFTGTIYCDGICHILAKKPFNEAMFTRSGNGKFIITIDPSLDLSSTSPKNPKLLPLGSNASISRTEVSKKFDLNGFVFTATGPWNIHITQAIVDNDVKKVRLLLAEQPKVKSDAFMLGILMLIAGVYGRIPLAQEFIRLGADINGQDARLSHPHLITAIILRQPAFVDALIKAGANPNVEDKDATPALIIAVIQNDITAVNALIKSAQLTIEAKFKGNQTALMYAAYAGYTKIVEALLQAGANPHIKDSHGFSALDFALNKHHKDIVKLIRQHHAQKLTYSSKKKTLDDSEQTTFTLTNCQKIVFAGLIGIMIMRYCYLHCYETV